MDVQLVLRAVAGRVGHQRDLVFSQALGQRRVPGQLPEAVLLRCGCELCVFDADHARERNRQAVHETRVVDGTGLLAHLEVANHHEALVGRACPHMGGAAAGAPEIFGGNQVAACRVAQARQQAREVVALALGNALQGLALWINGAGGVDQQRAQRRGEDEAHRVQHRLSSRIWAQREIFLARQSTQIQRRWRPSRLVL